MLAVGPAVTAVGAVALAAVIVVAVAAGEADAEDAEEEGIKRLLLQWHITDRCNLRCAHCYQEGMAGDELPFPQLLAILQQFRELLQVWGREQGADAVRGHITVTGGEPFVRADFYDLLQVIASQRKNLSFSILSNGSFIDQEMALRLRQLGPAFVQLSLEGTERTHDRIRGPGSFRRTLAAAQCLKKAKIRTLIAFTAHRGNFREFPEVAKWSRQIKVDRLWADRLVPRGRGSELEGLNPEETLEFFSLMHQARTQAGRSFFPGPEIAMQRGLQFLVGGGLPYHCTAGLSLITILPLGDLVPCRRLPLPVGNVLDIPLLELYYNSEILRRLADLSRTPSGCRDCFFVGRCRGGLRCLAYALTGDPFQADPGCWLAKKVTSNQL